MTAAATQQRDDAEDVDAVRRYVARLYAEMRAAEDAAAEARARAMAATDRLRRMQEERSRE
ncbi:MAG: hypothetical protein M5U32_15600 [Myxococcota bacterium]|nr:hypothetical protein [Myxococcota bacterium]